ncbi:MAG: zinc-ribbon domain-containing protein [Candidatus Hermodarchaeota archaeon]
MKHKTGIILLIIGGICMILGAVVGSISVFESLYEMAAAQWPDYEPFFDVIVNVIFRWIADLGGIAVIAGAILIALGAMKLGKFIIWIGLAFGTLALIIWIITQVVNFTGIVLDPPYDQILDDLYNNFNYGSGVGFAGVAIAIIGRAFIKKVKPPKVKEEEVEEVEKIEEREELEIKPPVPFQNVFCPNCGSSLPFNAEFCSECGHSIEKA